MIHFLMSLFSNREKCTNVIIVSVEGLLGNLWMDLIVHDENHKVSLERIIILSHNNEYLTPDRESIGCNFCFNWNHSSGC